MYEFFWLVLIGFMFCCLKAFHFTIKKCLKFDGLSGQETIGQHFPTMNCSKIGHLAYMKLLHTVWPSDPLDHQTTKVKINPTVKACSEFFFVFDMITLQERSSVV